MPLHVLSGFSIFIQLKRSEPLTNHARAQTWAWACITETEPEGRGAPRGGGPVAFGHLKSPHDIHFFLSPFSPLLYILSLPRVSHQIKAEMSHRTQILILKMQKLAW